MHCIKQQQNITLLLCIVYIITEDVLNIVNIATRSLQTSNIIYINAEMSNKQRTNGQDNVKFGMCNLAERGCFANSLSSDCLTDLLTEDWQAIEMYQ